MCGVDCHGTEAAHQLRRRALSGIHAPGGGLGRQERGGAEGGQGAVQRRQVPLLRQQSRQVQQRH